MKIAHTRDLYMIKPLDTLDGYIHDETTQVEISVTAVAKHAKKFWMSQNPINEYMVKIRCGEGGTDVLTIINGSSIVFDSEDGSKDNNQYFSVSKAPEYVEGQRYIYTFIIDKKNLAHDKQKLIITDNVLGTSLQKFEFIHDEGKINIPPITFSDDQRNNVNESAAKPATIDLVTDNDVANNEKINDEKPLETEKDESSSSSSSSSSDNKAIDSSEESEVPIKQIVCSLEGNNDKKRNKKKHRCCCCCKKQDNKDDSDPFENGILDTTACDVKLTEC
ncbi:hypothetical protein COBT_002024 [Conglomerata obtusa]